MVAQNQKLLSMKEVASWPNLVTILQLPVIGLFTFLSWQDRAITVLITSLILLALALDILDGWIARKTGRTTHFGAKVLEPVCGLILGLGLIISLMNAIGWEFRNMVLVVLLIGLPNAVLQIISWNADKGPIWRKMKRHQYWIHPTLYAILVTIGAGMAMWLATPNHHQISMPIFGVLVCWAIWYRREHLRKLIQEGQEAYC